MYDPFLQTPLPADYRVAQSVNQWLNARRVIGARGAWKVNKFPTERLFSPSHDAKNVRLKRDTQHPPAMAGSSRTRAGAARRAPVESASESEDVSKE